MSKNPDSRAAESGRRSSRWHVVAIALTLSLLAACRGSHRPRPVRQEDPRSVDVLAGVGFSSKDIDEFAALVVDGIGTKLPAREDQGAWRIGVHPIECRNLSALIDPDLIRNRIVAGVTTRLRHKADLFTPESEIVAEKGQREQAEGRRIGLEPPAGLLVHDLYLTGSLHELVHDSALGRSNYLQFSYRISDGSGRIVASDTIDYRRSQNRAPIYR
jgi:hypothetical protein